MPRHAGGFVRTRRGGFVALVVATVMAGCGGASKASVPAEPPRTSWEPLKVGGGGFVVGMADPCDSGATFVLRTDTYGGYVGDGAGPWQQLVTADSMPPSVLADFTSGETYGLSQGVFAVAVAPSDCDRLYMVFRGAIYRSTNRGTTWSAGSGYTGGSIHPNSSFSYFGEKLAVDPANPDHALASSQSALYRTVDGGASWAAVAGVPASTTSSGGYYAGMTGIVFDRSSAVVGGKTSVVYATSNGNGVYRSGDAGVTWSLLPGSPANVQHAATANGMYYAAVHPPSPSIHRYASGAWTTYNTAASARSIAIDRANPARIVVGGEGGLLKVSADGGATWSTKGSATRTAPNVPWMGFARETFMTNGSMRFDPQVPNKLWFSEGIGVWFTRDPDAAPTAWIEHSAGIEQMVAREVMAPPGSSYVFTGGMDRSLWKVPRANTAYPSRYGTEVTPSASLIFAWSLDYARTDTNHLVALINKNVTGQGIESSSYSLDHGETWTKFAAEPGAGGSSGDIAAPSLDAIIAVVGRKGLYRSTDRGASWVQVTLLDAASNAIDYAAPSPSDGSVTNAYALHGGSGSKKHVLAVDGADPNTVYLYFYGFGVYRSSDAGQTWALVNTSTFGGTDMYWNTKLRSVPGQAGHLFLMCGQAGGGVNPKPAKHLYRSTDGGTTWTTVSGFLEPYDVAAGKEAPGQRYPALYVNGWYGGVYGIWRSIDDAATWTQIGPWPHGSVDEINVLAASQDVYGDVYAALSGSGWVLGRTR